MPRTFAEIAPDRTVLRVVVCDDPGWLASNLGGEWVETFTEHEEVVYTGPGHGYDPEWPCRFAPQWVQPVAPDEGGAWPYNAGSVVFDEGALWVSMIDANVWQPGVSGWRQQPTQPGVPPPFVQPTGSHDAYMQGETITWTDGRVMRSTIDNNVWSPSAYPQGWTEVT